MTRFLPLLAVVLALAPLAQAQAVYNGLDAPYYERYDDDKPGVRLGLGLGAYIYEGPDLLVGSAALQDDVISTNLGLTAELTFPLANQLYGRLMGGVLNLGADDTRADLPSASTNPFLTSETILAEADLMYYLNAPGAGEFSPYVFTGLSGLFATGNSRPGVETAALAIPVGLGFEYGVSRNLALFAEGSYRFGLTEVGSAAAAALASVSDDVCDASGRNYNMEACKKKGGEPFCANGGDLPDCTEVIDNGDSDFRTRFNSGLLLGGLRFGFGGSPQRDYIPPPPPLPPVPVRPVDPPAPPPAPLVCDLVELNSIYFDHGSGSLDRRARTLLDENVDLLLDNSACCVFIDGYNDTSEGDRFGMGLAGRRAQAVYDYYLSRGVSSTRLTVRNRGTAAPDCDKEDPGPGCERNRRVESLPVDCERFQFLLENPSYDPY